MRILQKWTEYQPQKSTLVWGIVGGGILTMIVGFMWGGWVTGGTAQKMADQAAQTSRADVVASVCVENFRSASNARAQHEELVALRGYQQRGFVEEAEWAKLSGGLELSRDAASLCAERIVAIDVDDLPGPLAAADMQEAAPAAAGTAVQ